MNDIEILANRIIQKLKLRLFENKAARLNREPLIEMARLNLKEYGNVPFPSNKFNIKIWSNDHNPPHFHVIAEGWNIAFSIDDGRELNIKTFGSDSKMYNYIVKNIPIWLKMPCATIPNITNQYNAMDIWERLHDAND